MCILCILIPIIVGLLCALLGYFLGRQIEKKSKVYTKLRADLEKQQSENNSLRTENNSLRSELASLSKQSSSVEPEFDAVLAKSIFGKKIVENDLKIIEGIGPKIAELFHNAGIKTWKALSETSVESCQQILDDAGDRYRIHTPGSWPLQAEKAYRGHWKELKKWQDEMSGGKE